MKDDNEDKGNKGQDKASQYFDNPRFFKGKERQNYFRALLEHWEKDEHDPNYLDLRKVTVAEFYNKAMDTCNNDDILLENFFFKNIKLCDVEAVLKDFDQWMNKIGKGSILATVRKLVGVDFQIQGTDLSHTYDLQCFSNRMDDLFQWHTDENMRQEYVAPYFCLVQSSGMGKTKLMYEYKKKAVKNDIACLLILPPDVGPSMDGGVFDRIDYEIFIGKPKDAQDKGQSLLGESRAEAQRIFVKLDAELGKIAPTKTKNGFRKVVLLFDESQTLLKKEFELEAFRFRCIRLWLREKYRLQYHVVAVFAGTNSRLIDFPSLERDEMLHSSVYSSREVVIGGRGYYPKGENLYLPFYRTTTLGSCLGLLDEAEKKKGQPLNEYERAVYYGRPLFALLAKENKLDERIIIVVLYRMLTMSPLEERDWRESQLAWISLLSTRVQMGQTTREMASDLVAKSYAILVVTIPNPGRSFWVTFPSPCAPVLPRV